MFILCYFHLFCKRFVRFYFNRAQLKKPYVFETIILNYNHILPFSILYSRKSQCLVSVWNCWNSLRNVIMIKTWNLSILSFDVFETCSLILSNLKKLHWIALWIIYRYLSETKTWNCINTSSNCTVLLFMYRSYLRFPFQYFCIRLAYFYFMFSL